jgi:hypothetical protein
MVEWTNQIMLGQLRWTINWAIFYVISQNSKMTSWQFYFNTFEFNSIHLFLNTENIKWNAANACNKLVYYYASDCLFVIKITIGPDCNYN